MSFSEISISTQRLSIVMANVFFAEGLTCYYLQNQERLQNWEPKRAQSFYSLDNTKKRLKERELQMSAGTGLFFIVLDRESCEIVGECSFTNIVRGVFQACHLGFSINGDLESKGLMYEALSACISCLFNTVQLHRIMANYQPKNLRSGRLLEKLGFEREGYAKSYLQINGIWEDHVLCSIINPDF